MSKGKGDGQESELESHHEERRASQADSEEGEVEEEEVVTLGGTPGLTSPDQWRDFFKGLLRQVRELVGELPSSQQEYFWVRQREFAIPEDLEDLELFVSSFSELQWQKFVWNFLFEMDELVEELPMSGPRQFFGG